MLAHIGSYCVRKFRVRAACALRKQQPEDELTTSTRPQRANCDVYIYHVILTPNAGVAEWQTLRT
jgi:hypothetical protein